MKHHWKIYLCYEIVKSVLVCECLKQRTNYNPLCVNFIKVIKKLILLNICAKTARQFLCWLQYMVPIPY